MPWLRTDPMQQRMLFVQEARRARVSMSMLCRVFGISRKTGYKWLVRAEDGGATAMVDQSRRPHSSPRATADDVVERLVRLREEHPTWGARKLLAWLQMHEGSWVLPAASTVTNLLKRRGLVASRRRPRRGTPCRGPLVEATAPNIAWSVDFKGDFRVGDGTRCYPLTVTDTYTRMALCCRALTSTARLPVQHALERTFREWGLPDRMRSDNGTPFGTMCTGPLSRLSVWLVKVGVRPEYIDPGKPQQNGRHERFHLTLKQETAYPPARTLAAQQRRFDAFRCEYNEVRPHEALGQRPPMSVHSPSTRTFPSRVTDPVYPKHYEVKRIGNRGYFRWHGASHFVAETLSGELVGYVEVDTGAWELYFGPLLIGRLHVALADLGTLRPQRLSPMSPV